jgi:DNA-binding FadR family transcriptional regulator
MVTSPSNARKRAATKVTKATKTVGTTKATRGSKAVKAKATEATMATASVPAGTEAASGPRPAALLVSKVRPAYHQVAEQLRELILAGDLVPGARLPTEPELSTMFGVSRTTVREALRVLSSQHLVVTTRGASGGTSVAQPEPEYIGDFLEMSFGLMSGAATVTVDQFLELREQIEVPAARLAAERRTDGDLLALEACLTHSVGHPDGAGAGEERASFHKVLLAATGNPLLSVVARPVVEVLRGHFLRELAPPEFWEDLTRDHEEIFALIKAGNGPGAGDAMLAHLNRMWPVYRRVEKHPPEH